MAESNYISVGEIAKELGFSDQTVYGWLRNGWLRSKRYGKHWKISRADYEEFKAHPPEGLTSTRGPQAGTSTDQA